MRDAVPALVDLIGGDERVFVGGPVQPHAAVVVADFDRPDLAGLLAFDSVGFLIGDVEPDQLRAVRRARVFAGYAGWGAGQLEHEMQEEGSWIVEDARPDDVFSDEPEGALAERRPPQGAGLRDARAHAGGPVAQLTRTRARTRRRRR